jgi:hypothetical protein
LVKIVTTEMLIEPLPINTNFHNEYTI